MEEIIATKQKYAAKGAKFSIVFGAVILILCVLAYILYPAVLWRLTFLDYYDEWELKYLFILGIVLGAALVIVGGFMLFRAHRVPEIIIKYADGILYFYDGFSCRIEEVDSVRCSLVHTRYRWEDKLTVVVNGSERTYKMIESVQRASDRIIELMMKSRERTSVKLDYKSKGE